MGLTILTSRVLVAESPLRNTAGIDGVGIHLLDLFLYPTRHHRSELQWVLLLTNAEQDEPEQHDA